MHCGDQEKHPLFLRVFWALRGPLQSQGLAVGSRFLALCLWHELLDLSHERDCTDTPFFVPLHEPDLLWLFARKHFDAHKSANDELGIDSIVLWCEISVLPGKIGCQVVYYDEKPLLFWGGRSLRPPLGSVHSIRILLVFFILIALDTIKNMLATPNYCSQSI
jgi:hypothetical protein